VIASRTPLGSVWRPGLRRLARALLAPVLLAGMLAACGQGGGDAGDGPGSEKIVLRYRLADQPRAFDPQLAITPTDRRLASLLFIGLLGYDAAGKLAPAVAESWTISDDGLRYLFRLRPTVWSNGQPVTAQDFVNSIRRILDPDIRHPLAPLFMAIDKADDVRRRKVAASRLGVRAIDSDILEIELVRPMPGFLALLADPAASPVPMATVRRYRQKWTTPERIVTNGPFLLGRIGDTAIELRRFDKFAAPRPAFIGTVTLSWDDRASVVAAIKAGRLDLAEANDVPLTPADAARFQQTDPPSGLTAVLFNPHARAFEALSVRRALAMMVDSATAIDEIGARRQLVPLNALMPANEGPADPAYLAEWAAWTPEQRLNEAARLLKEAGYSDAHPLVFRLAMPRGVAIGRLAEALAAQWAGLPVRITAESRGDFAEQEHLEKGKFDAALWIWSPEVDAPEAMIVPFLCQGGRANLTGYCNASVDDLYAQAVAALTPQQRDTLLRQAQKIILDDAVAAPLHGAMRRVLVSPRVVGWVVNERSRHPLQLLSVQGQGLKDQGAP